MSVEAVNWVKLCLFGEKTKKKKGTEIIVKK